MLQRRFSTFLWYCKFSHKTAFSSDFEGSEVYSTMGSYFTVYTAVHIYRQNNLIWWLWTSRWTCFCTLKTRANHWCNDIAITTHQIISRHSWYKKLHSFKVLSVWVWPPLSITLSSLMQGQECHKLEEEKSNVFIEPKKARKFQVHSATAKVFKFFMFERGKRQNDKLFLMKKIHQSSSSSSIKLFNIFFLCSAQSVAGFICPSSDGKHIFLIKQLFSLFNLSPLSVWRIFLFITFGEVHFSIHFHFMKFLSGNAERGRSSEMKNWKRFGTAITVY